MDPSQVRGVVVALVDPREPTLDGELNRWLTEVHCPDAAQTPGCIAWSRYENIDPDGDQPRYLNLYEFGRADMAAAKADLDRVLAKKREQGRVRHLARAFHLGAHRTIFHRVERAGTPEGLVLVMTSVADPGREAEYNEWYNTRHLPAIIATPGMTGGMRFRCEAADFTPVDYLQLFFIGEADVAAVRRAMGETLSRAPEAVRSSGGMARPVVVATYRRITERHSVAP